LPSLFPFPPLRAHLILKFSFSGCSRSTWNTWNNFNLEPKYMHSWFPKKMLLEISTAWGPCMFYQWHCDALL
jgi:hypothetical protein